MTPVLKVKNLRTYFSGEDKDSPLSRAVDDISFSIEKGRTLALVGESGCGKSITALSIIQLIPKPHGYLAAGTIKLNGKEITKLGERDKRRLRGSAISMIFQEPMTSLNPVFTIGEQISEVIRLHRGLGKSDARREAVSMLDRVKLPCPGRVYNEYPHRLSGGMRQRVMIAIALVCRPSLLIADEPTTALDVTIQEEILELIKEMRSSLDMGVLLISHNLAVVYRNAEDVGVMYGGKIVEEAPTPLLFRNPMHPYTLKLLRSIPDSEKRGKTLETIPGTVPAPTEYPKGCRFAGRCDREMQGCRDTLPILTEIETDHKVACHLYDKAFMASEDATPMAKERTEVTTLTPAQRTQAALVEIKDLKCHFPVKKGLMKKTVGYVKAVDGIDLTIKKASTLALVGESGCGKTTAGKAILRLNEPTAGRIIYDGQDITGLSRSALRPFRTKMQIIFQDPYSSLNPRMMIGGIIEEGLKSLRPELSRKDRTEKIAETMRLVGLTPDMTKRYPHEFSGGQRQRIGIARVLAVEPAFIICDEATSALDVSVQAQILNLLKSIQKELGISLLFITHDLGVVEYIADEVCVMHKGRIVERGTVDDIFNTPKNDYTKKLLAAVPRIR
ncbi:Oligopeptide transport ATP-binding protein OppF (TC 3.A.1.5.1) [hydrothermal vent metagenome]|uniref:Oligopeptide transport ATP-binding protein OppF (TC 3.A.1.5.1) n=1 Tax=hydrothermal vent metagenome TaxID=652676 RepID=A0A3B0VC34_9ZZZZ